MYLDIRPGGDNKHWNELGDTLFAYCMSGGGWGVWQIRDFIRVFVHNKLSVDQNQWNDSKEPGGEEERGDHQHHVWSSAQNIASVATTNVFIVRSALKYVTRPGTRHAETRGHKQLSYPRTFSLRRRASRGPHPWRPSSTTPSTSSKVSTSDM